MTPKILPSTISPETIDTTREYGYLGNAHYCQVKQVLNGQYELTMKYPVDGNLFDKLQLRNVIMATVDRSGEYQPFRIYNVSKPIKGIVKVNARHIAYDLDGVVVLPFETVDVQTTLAVMKQQCVNDNPFDFVSTRTTAAPFRVRVPEAIWNLMGGQQGSLLDTYGGEYKFDKYTIRFENRIGTDRGVSVRYGVNMTDYEQDSNCASCFTAVLAYWQSEDSVVYGNIVNAEGTFDHVRVKPVDMSFDFDEEPTVEQLDAAAASYARNNEIGVPTVSWKVSFIPLDTTEEYKHLSILERVDLGDTVRVFFERYGVEATSRVKEIVWDSLRDRYVSVTLGSIRNSLAKTISGMNQEIENKPSSSEIVSIAEQIVNTLTGSILGATGGAVRLLDTDGDGEPDTLYIADNPDPSEAVRVWRFNYMGWGASSNGYNGPFVMGATLDAGLLAEFVTAANLTAGTIRSRDGTTFYLNLDEGILQMGNFYTKEEADQQTDSAIGRFVRIQDGMIYIGLEGNNIQLVESNDKVAFVDKSSGVEVAYISNERFYTPNLTVLETADFGGYRMNVSNGISFKWVGRE